MTVYDKVVYASVVQLANIRCAVAGIILLIPATLLFNTIFSNMNPMHTLYIQLACLRAQSSVPGSFYTFPFAGSLAPFEVDLELWPKEGCYEATVNTFNVVWVVLTIMCTAL